MRLQKYLYFLTFLLLVISCRKTKNSSENEQQPVITLGPNTVQIDNSTSQIIDTVTEQSVVFTGSTTQINNLKVGDIIVSGIATKAPAGFLRKITAIEKNGNTIRFNTIFVSLIEAFLNLNIDETISLPEIPLNFGDLVLYDEDGNDSTTFDQVRVNSIIKLNADLRVKININKGKLDYAFIGGGVKKDITSNVVCGGSVLRFNKERKIFEQFFAPISVPGTPLVVVPTISVSFGANGSVSVEVTYSKTEKGSGGSYMEFKNGNWNPVSERSFNQTTNFNGSFGNVNLKSFLRPTLNLKLWGLDAAKVITYAEVYTSLTAQVAPYQPCELKAGITGRIEASLRLFDDFHVSTAYPPLFDESKVLYTCASTPPLIADFNVDKRIITAGESVSFTDQSIGGPTAWSWSFPGGAPSASTNQNPTNIRYNAAGTYNVTLTVTKGSENKSVTKNGFITVNSSAIQLPTVSTTTVTAITSNSASSGGNITNDGGAAITARGVCWSTNQNPTTANSKTIDGIGSGSFTSNITSLNANTTYYVRAYATNSTGTSYGSQQIFTTNVNSGSETVTIGTQVWMLKNLDITTYRNGDPIPQVTDPTAWANLTTGAWCYYNNGDVNNTIYGKLYNWYAINDPRGLAPVGWHMPTEIEWSTLITFLGGESIAGGKMKAVSALWQNPNLGATNSSGFTGLPSGKRLEDGLFHGLGFGGFFGGFTQQSSMWAYELGYSINNINKYAFDKRQGISVRCIKD